MGRISALTELTTLATNDYLIVLDSSANIAKKITVANAFGIPDFGWTSSGETWTFSSFSSSTRIGVLTVPTNATTKYTAGMKVKITQTTGGTKYGVIVGVTATTLSIFFGLNITLNNEAITSPSYSIGYMPLGYTGPILTKEQYQADTTNSERWVYSITGWGSIAGAATTQISDTAIPYGITFATAPIVVASFGGHTASGGASYPPLGTGYSDNLMVNPSAQTTTTFSMTLGRAGANFSAGHTLFYGWHARGPVS